MNELITSDEKASARDALGKTWQEYIRDHCTTEQQASIYGYAMKLLSVPSALNSALESELRILAETAEAFLGTSL